MTDQRCNTCETIYQGDFCPQCPVPGDNHFVDVYDPRPVCESGAANFHFATGEVDPLKLGADERRFIACDPGTAEETVYSKVSTVDGELKVEILDPADVEMSVAEYKRDLVNELQQQLAGLLDTAKNEVCSSIRHEQKMMARGFVMAIQTAMKP